MLEVNGIFSIFQFTKIICLREIMLLYFEVVKESFIRCLMFVCLMVNILSRYHFSNWKTTNSSLIILLLWTETGRSAWRLFFRVFLIIWANSIFELINILTKFLIENSCGMGERWINFIFGGIIHKGDRFPSSYLVLGLKVGNLRCIIVPGIPSKGALSDEVLLELRKGILGIHLIKLFITFHIYNNIC